MNQVCCEEMLAPSGVFEEEYQVQAGAGTAKYKCIPRK